MVAPTAAVPASRIEGVGGAKLEPDAPISTHGSRSANRPFESLSYDIAMTLSGSSRPVPVTVTVTPQQTF